MCICFNLILFYPDCQDPKMKMTRFCIERGESVTMCHMSYVKCLIWFTVWDISNMLSCWCVVGSLWQPNISLTLITAVKEGSALAVSFSPDRLCDEYIVIVSCSAIQHVEHINKVKWLHDDNQMLLYLKSTCAIGCCTQKMNVVFSSVIWPRTVGAHYNSLRFVP